MTQNITDVDELEVGDKVTVTGNGLEITSEVEVIESSSWTGKMTATLAPEDGRTVSLTDADHPLQSGGLTAGVGAVNVERAE